MRQYVFGIAAVTVLAGCGDPLGGMARLSDVSNDEAATVSVAPAAQSGEGTGLFSRLLNRTPDDPASPAVEAALAEVPTAEAVAEETRRPASPRSGLFGLFGGNRDSADRDQADVVPAVAPAPPRGLTGLFGNSAGRDIPRSGPDRNDVTAGTSLPFGEIARVCGVSRAQLGTRIDDGGGFSVYDTNPDLTTPRPFYITGFNDGCARTFTGAVAVAGNIQTHEFVRYQPSNERISYTSTDNAYEAIKASVCRVGRGQPCGARADRLNRNTYFVSVYSFFGGTFSAVPTEWTQILLHDGAVLSTSVKNN